MIACCKNSLSRGGISVVFSSGAAASAASFPPSSVSSCASGPSLTVDVDSSLQHETLPSSVPSNATTAHSSDDSVSSFLPPTIVVYTFAVSVHVHFTRTTYLSRLVSTDLLFYYCSILFPSSCRVVFSFGAHFESAWLPAPFLCGFAHL